MALSVVFRRAARRELDDAVDYYEVHRRGLGRRFVVEVDRALREAAEDPLRFPLAYRELRVIRTRRFPYSIFFVVDDRRLVVIAVFHARRDPSTLRRRTRSV